MVCAFTGHRPERLPWGADESDERCMALKALMIETIREVCENGCRAFLCGMARGCDTYFAECVLAVRQSGFPDVRLTAMIPCPSQASSWTDDERKRYDTLCKCCDDVRVLEPLYSDGCMLRRNRAMVDEADLIISVWDGSSGGTASTVRYAERCDKPIRRLWC